MYSVFFHNIYFIPTTHIQIIHVFQALCMYVQAYSIILKEKLYTYVYYYLFNILG